VAPAEEKAAVTEEKLDKLEADAAPAPASHPERSEAESNRNAADAVGEAGLSNPGAVDLPGPMVAESEPVPNTEPEPVETPVSADSQVQ
jgi:hypothetical protein